MSLPLASMMNAPATIQPRQQSGEDSDAAGNRPGLGPSSSVGHQNELEALQQSAPFFVPGIASANTPYEMHQIECIA